MTDQGKQPNPGATAQPHETKESLKHRGRDAAHDVSEAAHQQAESYFTKQRDNVAEQSEKFTSVLHKMADEFDQQEQPYFSKQARKVADTTDRMSHKLRDKDLRSVCDEAQSFSRREPALFVGGLIAAGFLASRFLRSSSKHTHGNDGYSNTTDERSTGRPMEESVPAATSATSPGSATPTSTYSQSSSLSGGPSQKNGV